MAVHVKGDRVSQAQYGLGTVTEADERHTVIDFDDHGPRRFVTRMVRLAPSDSPAPARPKRRRTRKIAES